MRKAALGIGIGAVAIIAMHVGLVITNDLAGNSWPVRPMTKNFRDLPKTLGEWSTVEASELDSEVFATLNATDAEQRTYEDNLNNKISYHGSIFEHFYPGVQHSPLVCYPAHGWHLLDQSSVEIKLSDGTVFTPKIVTFEKEGMKVFVLFWFQFGDLVVVDNEEMRVAMEHYRPDQKWPSMLKVLMQMPVSTDIHSTEALQELAAHVYEYTRTIQDGQVPAPVQDTPQ